MPTYDYRCRACGKEFEAIHSMHQTKPAPCEACGSKNTTKVPSLCGIVVHNTNAVISRNDRRRRNTDARQDLAENHGVEKLCPIAGNTFESAYNDIKATGSLTKDKMQAQRAINQEKAKRKQRDWLEKANKRVAHRTKVAEKKKAEEAAAKRRIVL